MEKLSWSPEEGEVRCPNLVVLNVSETKLSGEGLAVFIHTHPRAVRGAIQQLLRIILNSDS
jgi:hypothetical protein